MGYSLIVLILFNLLVNLVYLYSNLPDKIIVTLKKLLAKHKHTARKLPRINYKVKKTKKGGKKITLEMNDVKS